MTDNQQLRELFTLPPIQSSANTALAAPEMPPQQTVTGDREVDAVLWLQQVVKTGNQALIDKALEAAKRITTPMEELGRRYADHIVRSTGNTLGAAFASFGFGDLEDQAKRAVQRAARQHEALSRFGTVDALFANTPAEKACKKALRGLKRADFMGYDGPDAAERFAKHSNLTPATISDCLHVIAYWDALYWLRADTVEHGGDILEQAAAHKYYCRDMMAIIAPRNKAEALAAFEHLLEDGEGIQDRETTLRNLITSGWKASAKEAS